MSRLPGHRPGAWVYSCPRCSFDVWSNEVVREPVTGLRVCRDCVDAVNPQMYVQGRVDRQRVPFSNNPPIVFYDPFSGITPSPANYWILISGRWDDAGVWDDTAHWIDGATSDWILTTGSWNDSGVWSDASNWID